MRALAVTRVAALVADVLSLPITSLQPVGRYPGLRLSVIYWIPRCGFRATVARRGYAHGALLL